MSAATPLFMSGFACNMVGIASPNIPIINISLIFVCKTTIMILLYFLNDHLVYTFMIPHGEREFSGELSQICLLRWRESKFNHFVNIINCR